MQYGESRDNGSARVHNGTKVIEPDLWNFLSMRTTLLINRFGEFGDSTKPIRVSWYPFVALQTELSYESKITITDHFLFLVPLHINRDTTALPAILLYSIDGPSFHHFNSHQRPDRRCLLDHGILYWHSI